MVGEQAVLVSEAQDVRQAVQSKVLSADVCLCLSGLLPTVFDHLGDMDSYKHWGSETNIHITRNAFTYLK